MLTRKLFLSALFVATCLGTSVEAEDQQPVARFGGPPPADVLFDRFDANDDGALTADEVFAPMWVRLKNADSDGDDKVTRAEYDAATGN